MKKRLLFIITQFYKGGAETALLNLFHVLEPKQYEIDFLIFDQMILSNATSLIPQIPDWINVCNAAEKEGKGAVCLKVLFKIWQRLTGRQLYRPSAYRFVKDKAYDIVFSYGEWLSPEFAAKKVNAVRRYIWIHTDIDKAGYVDERILFRYDSKYTGYLFVSEHSKKSAEERFPIVKGKSFVVHNLCDESAIRKLSEQVVEQYRRSKEEFLLVTVGNLRDEKNYPRHIEVMRELKKRRLPCRWICIGSTANMFLYQRLKALCNEYELDNDFCFIGVKENPYPYIKQADLIAVLSDFESWSLVITEAKILGVPIIATRTSGALEQITNGVNGILTGFEVKEIADKMEEYIFNPEMQKRFRKNLEGYSIQNRVLEELDEIFGS